MNLREDGTIYEFEEKPENPKSNKASMGVYIFTWKKLREYLERDEQQAGSSNDFGKNIIPDMLADGQRMVAYPFDGYWKDVGTVDSLWEANLDLLNPKVQLDLGDPQWRIYSHNPVVPPHYASPEASIQNALISEGCEVDGTIDFSILFAGVRVEEGAEVRDSIIMPGAVIEQGALVQYAVVAENAVIQRGAVVGGRPEDTADKSQWGIAVVGAGAVVKEGVRIPPKAMVEFEEEAKA